MGEARFVDVDRYAVSICSPHRMVVVRKPSNKCFPRRGKHRRKAERHLSDAARESFFGHQLAGLFGSPDTATRITTTDSITKRFFSIGSLASKPFDKMSQTASLSLKFP